VLKYLSVVLKIKDFLTYSLGGNYSPVPTLFSLDNLFHNPRKSP